MKKLFLTLGFAAVISLVSCGDKKAGSTTEENASKTEQKADATEEVVEEATQTPAESIESQEPEDEGYKPPFTVSAFWERDGEQFGSRDYYEIEIKKNGTFTGTLKREEKDSRSNYEWYTIPSNISDFEGKWTVNHRLVGEDYQRVYVLTTSGGRDWVYIPDDGEYLWDAMILFDHPSDWEDCTNLNLKNAVKITKVTKN